MDFKGKCEKLKKKIEPLILKICKELVYDYEFDDSEYYYNHQIEYHNHKVKLNKYVDSLENILNEYLGFNTKGFFMKLFPKKSVSVVWEVSGVIIYIPFGDKGTIYYAKSLILFETLDSMEGIEKCGGVGNICYEIHPYYMEELL